MKVRSVKLKEAHKNIGSNAFCSILWDLKAEHLITSSASDPSILIHDVLQPSKTPREIRHHRDGVTALCLSPNSTCLASGSVDHSVRLYSFPGGEFQSNITRFTLPIRTLAFNKSGSLLAAAGDDEGIKLIATIDGSISRVLKGHKGSVTGVAFDPTNEYLASIDGFGTVIYWELSSGKTIHTLKGIASHLGSDLSTLNVLSWSPDGETLAVPGLKNDVVMYDRDTAEKLFSLKGEHERPVCFVSWSPNGKYIATSGLDRQVLIWDVEQRHDIDRQKFDDKISCLSWRPNGNALAVIDVAGNFGIWDTPIPSRMISPTDGAPSIESRTSNGVLLFDEDIQEPSTSGNTGDIDVGTYEEELSHGRKRLRKRSLLDENVDDDSDDLDQLLPHVEQHEKINNKGERYLKEKMNRVQPLLSTNRSKIQEPFQPGSTTGESGKRHFLCYNMLGTITSINNDGYSHIEVDFHDTSRGPRVSSMTDYFGFTMASLNESGSVFANPCKGNKNMSTLMYRPFSSWANNSEWSMRFEFEEVRVVALGAGWVACVTNLNFLRIFTGGGLQKHILSLDGPVVTAAGMKDELAIVSHASESLSSGDQVLQFRVFNISKGSQVISGHLPLTPGSFLTWFGFSEEGRLSSYDSKGVLRVFTEQFGGNWLPLFSASKEKSEEESYWVVGLNASTLFCIICKPPNSQPVVMPKPVLTPFRLSFPLASSDLGALELENEFMMLNLNLSQIQKRIEELAANGFDTTTLDDEAFNLETALDRCILRLIANCCNADKLVRATELAQLLSLEKSIKGAIKLVTALKLPILAERFYGLLEEKETSETTGLKSNPDSVSRAIIPIITKSQSLKTKEENRILSSDPPQFSKGDNSEEKANKMEEKYREKSEPSITLSNISPQITKREKQEEKDRKIIGNKMENNRIETDSIMTNVINSDKVHRPMNPFLKSSDNKNKSSLFDSIKKMKTSEG